MNILIDSNLYGKEDFGNSFDFLLAHGLIVPKEYLLSYKVLFVGEVITPSDHFISLPKNFTQASEENAELVKGILKEFKTLKKRGKLLMHNKSYSVGDEIYSRFYYWRKLFTYFTDYITYEFFFPKQRKIIHSTKPQIGRLNPMLTEKNLDKYGKGFTYEVKNWKESEFRNIYYTTLKSLELEFASEKERKKIQELEDFLRKKQIEFKVIELKEDEVVRSLKKELVNPIHETIKKTLLNFYLSAKIKEKSTINVFFTREFEYLFEYLLQGSLGHNLKYKNDNWSDPNYKTLHPDVVTPSFIGDAKYYRIESISNSSLEKELYAYNVANGNSQPNFVFIPSENTAHLETLIHQEYRLEVVSVDLATVLKDFRSGGKSTLSYVQSILR